MATEAGELIIKISADVEEMKSAMKAMSDKLGATATESVVKGTLIADALKRIGKFAWDMAKDSVQAFGEQEVALIRLTAIVGKDAADAFAKYAARLQDVSTFSDESIMAVQAQLTTFGLLPGSVNQATRVLMDYASATGKDLPEAANIFGQALAGQSRELRKYGLQILESDDRSTRMAKTMEFLTEKFHGTAEEIRNSTIGSIEHLKNRFNDLEERIGKILSPTVSKLVGWLEKAVGFMEQLTGATYANATATQQQLMVAERYQGMIKQALQGQVDYRHELETELKVHNLTDDQLRNMMVTYTNQIKTLKAVETQEKKTAEEGAKGMKAARTAAEQAVDAKISALKKELEVSEEVFRRQNEMSGMVTQKKILDSKNELAQMQADQTQITVITQLETEKRILAAQQSYDANASFSDQLRVKMAEDISQNTGAWVNMATTMMDSFAQSTAKMIVEGGKFSDVLKNMWKQLAEMIIAQILRMIAQWLVWMALTGGAGGAFAGFMAEGGMINEPSVIVGLKSGKRHIAGEAGPEMVVPAGGGGSGNVAFSGGNGPKMGGGDGGGANITINIQGQFIEGSQTKWQRLIQEQIAPQVRRLAMKDPNSLITRKRGAMS